MKHKKLICLLLSLIFCFAMVPMTAMAAEAPEGVWTDYAADSFESGTGTQTDPYVIATAEQLAKLAVDVNSGVDSVSHSGEYFVLSGNIDLSAHRWRPIGDGAADRSFHAFQGHFDGQNHTITGLYVDESIETAKDGLSYNAGLFGNVANAATSEELYDTIVNLHLKDVYVKAGGEYGAAGALSGFIANSGTHIVNCSVEDGTVTGEGKNGESGTGGLVGYTAWTVFENCTANVSVISNVGCVGGFVGNTFGNTFNNCVAYGDVEGGWSVGGFAGILFWRISATNCAAHGNVTAHDWNAGGFAGFIQGTYGNDGVSATLTNCSAYGDVTSDVDGWQARAGGFAGTLWDDPITIDNCHAAGKVTVSEETAGGFIGRRLEGDNGTLIDCSYNKEANDGLNAIGGASEGAANPDTIVPTTPDKARDNACKATYGGHNPEKVAAKAATCTTDGWNEYYVCSHCGVCVDANGGLSAIPVTSALGHDFGDWVVTKEPTADKAGYQTRTCSRCDAEEVERIPATGEVKPTEPTEPEKPTTPADPSIPIPVERPEDGGSPAEPSEPAPDEPGTVVTPPETGKVSFAPVLLLAAAAVAVVVLRKKDAE